MNLTDEYMKDLLIQTVTWARHSPDPSTQNGAVLLNSSHQLLPVTFAVNEFPKGVKYSDDRWERPIKHSYIEHAERNAIYNAARNGISTWRLTLVCPWAACADCARGIIQSGIKRLITLAPKQDETHDRWVESIAVAMVMLEEANIEVIYINGPLGVDPIRRDGIPYFP